MHLQQYSLGTNPIAFGAPGKEDDYYMLDMATSAVALGKVGYYTILLKYLVLACTITTTK